MSAASPGAGNAVARLVAAAARHIGVVRRKAEACADQGPPPVAADPPWRGFMSDDELAIHDALDDMGVLR